MKLTLLIPASVLLLGALTALPAADQLAMPSVAVPPAPTRTFTDPEILEMLGWLAGNSTQLSQFNFTEAELASINKGFASAAGGKAEPFKREEIEAQFSKFMDARVEATKKAADEKQKSFLSDIKQKKGVVALPSGLLYEIVQEGKGSLPKATDTVRVNYTGALIDGTVFDATSKHTPAEPSEFPLNGVIPGWTEGIQKINKGGKIKLYIPSNLAYGPEGRPPVIPPSATLVFDVELIDIK